MSAFAILLLLQLPSADSAGSMQTYGDTLIAATVAHHPEISGLDVTVSSVGRDPIHLHKGGPTDAKSGAGLLDALGHPIGMVATSSSSVEVTQAIAKELARNIYAAETLGEPDPFVPGAVNSRLGQAIVDVELRKHPLLVTLAMHVSLPGAANRIIASSFGRIGKQGDADDLKVIRSGTSLAEMTDAGRRRAIELPLLDARHRTIGALSTSFALEGPAGAATADKEALLVQAEIAKQIPDLAALRD